MREFRFQAAAGAPGFLPGQYALFYLPGLAAPRTYSMSNVDEGGGAWEFIVRRVPGGTGTVTLFDKLPEGSDLLLDGPYGLAYLRADHTARHDPHRRGSGLAPVLSIARGAVREPKLAGRKIHVFYGARAPRDLCGAAELGALPGYGARLFFHPVLSEPPRSRRLAGNDRLRARGGAPLHRRALGRVRVLLRRARRPWPRRCSACSSTSACRTRRSTSTASTSCGVEAGPALPCSRG